MLALEMYLNVSDIALRAFAWRSPTCLAFLTATMEGYGEIGYSRNVTMFSRKSLMLFSDLTAFLIRLVEEGLEAVE